MQYAVSGDDDAGRSRAGTRMSDILIMGSGIVGNLAAAYLRHHFPAQRVTVVGRTDPNLPVVGESLVEYSTLFLQRIGLGQHLVEDQFPKYGLTFYYKLDPASPRDPRYVVDEAPTNPLLTSFLVNRFSFDERLRRFNRRNGVEYVDGKVTGVAPSDDRIPAHRVTAQRVDGAEATYAARWLIDATGRRRFLARQLGLGCGVARQRSAFWFRLADFDASILERIAAVTDGTRLPAAYYSAHHFFGRGNWIWLIPIRDAAGRRLISIGVTWRPDLRPAAVTCMPEFLQSVASEHPVVADLVRSGTVVDTNLYRNYMYRTRQRYSAGRWFLVGDAADTVDPLYSSGLALAAVAIEQVGAMIRRDLDGRLTGAFARDLDNAYAAFHGLSDDSVARLYEVMQDGFQCHLRMHLSVTAIFHMAMPLLLNGYHTDAVGSALMARLGRPGGELARQLSDFDPLIARAAARRTTPSTRDFVRVQSTFALNHAWFEHRRDDAIPRSIAQMFRRMAELRLRLLWTAGPRWWWYDPGQLGGLLRSLVWMAGTLALGRQSLKQSRLIRWFAARAATPVATGRTAAERVRSAAIR